MATKPNSTENDANKPAKSTSTTSTEEEFFPLSFFQNHKFETPTKRISIPAHIGKFVTSPTYTKLIKFFNDLAESVKQKKLTDEVPISSTTSKFLSILAKLDAFADEIEPLQTQSRYGNKAYRLWRDKVKQQSRGLLHSLLPASWTNASPQQQEHVQQKQSTTVSPADEQKQSSETAPSVSNNKNPLIERIIDELDGYFNESFGNYTRIDYGTGHELTFLCFILILVELRVLRRSDYSAIILRIFSTYIELMRKLQVRYALEPAGTKGVWGLDDYQFLSFYFGAAQLIEHPEITPKDILNKQVLQQYSKEYLYLSSIEFILKVKTGPFSEHSPLLNDITAVPLWLKVKSGLLKMYQDDVLKKLPVVQHFLFGSILTIDLPPIDKDANGDSEKAEILKRKQALIAKLNAKNPKFNTQQNSKGNQPQHGQTQQAAPMVMTAAPWAQSSSNNANSNANQGGNDLPVTKAPWAK